jgi:hypothetical protein
MAFRTTLWAIVQTTAHGDPMRAAAFLVTVLAACASSPASSPASKPTTPPTALPPAAPAVAPVQPTPALAKGMARLAFMRGVWAGPATGTLPTGQRYTVTQTERMGPMLGGDIVVVEGRGYRDDGSTGFNAFAVVSWDPRADRYELRSYAQGQVGTFEMKLTADGYTWEIPAGPGAVIRFTATIKNGTWREVGEYVAGDKPPVQTFEMNLRRVGDTDWPLGAPIPPSVAKP